jgi:glycine/D-amino acid oxidase-like deaminating enzyme
MRDDSPNKGAQPAAPAANTAAIPLGDASADVAVIGGGIMGCAVAYYLAANGVDVAVIERRELNREASGVNAGSLHFQVYLHANHDPEWIEGIRPSVELHRQAAVGWRTLEAELGAEFGVRQGGGLMVAESAEDMALLREKVRIENSMGLATELVDTREMMTIAPYLSDRLRGADYCRDEGLANPFLVTPAFARGAVARGARIHTNTEVRSIERREGGGFAIETSRGRFEAGRIIDAAGAWGGQVSRMAGLRIPIWGNSIHMNVTEALPPTMNGQLIQHAGRRLSLKQSQDGTFIIGGAWPAAYDEETGAKTTLLDSIAGNVWVAAQTVPALRWARVNRTWAGMGTNSDSDLPIIGECGRLKGFFVLFATLGFALGPTCARLLAEQMTGHAPSIAIDPFSPDRL